MRKRRAEVDLLVAAKKPRISLDPDVEDMEVGQGEWTGAQAKEQAFQENKRLQRFMEAMDQGYALPIEETTGAKQALALWNDHQQKVSANYLKNQAARDLVLTSERVTDTVNLTIYVEHGCDVGNVGAFNRLLRAQGIRKVFDRLQANLFLVDDINNPGQRNRWCAILSGGILCTLKWLQSGSKSGASIAFKSALASHRQIWASPAFVTAHPEVHRILLVKVPLSGGRFKFIENKEKLLDLGSRRSAAGHGGEVVAFVTAAEQMSEDSSYTIPTSPTSKW